jgi:hypothetical protein
MLGPFVYGLKINSGIYRKALLLEAMCIVQYIYIYIYIYVSVSLDIYATKSMKTCAGPDFFPSIFTNVGAICAWIENQLRHF